MHKIGEVVVLDGRNFHGTYFGNIVSKEVNFANNRNPTKNLKPSTKVKTGCHVCF